LEGGGQSWGGKRKGNVFSTGEEKDLSLTMRGCRKKGVSFLSGKKGIRKPRGTKGVVPRKEKGGVSLRQGEGEVLEP